MRQAALIVLLMGGTLSAQTRLDETIEVSIVNVDVVVTDRDGNRVSGLTAKDFELRQDGRPQPITNFAEYGEGMSRGTLSVEAAETPQPQKPVARAPRTIVLFMEIARLTTFQAEELFDSIRNLLHATVAPGDRVTIVTWLDEMQVRQPFTDDLATLDGVLSTLEADYVRGPRELAADIRRQQAESDADIAEMEASLRRGGVRSGTGDMPAVHSLLAAKRQRFQIRRKGLALEGLMQTMSALDGRKILIMAMRRFGVHAGVEYFGGSLPIETQSELDTSEFRDSLIRTANAHGITLYPVYPPGLRWDPVDASVAGDGFAMGSAAIPPIENNVTLNETTALNDMAVKTGGLMAWGSRNIADLLPRVAEDLETYYSLGYRAPATGKDVARRIEVTTKDPRYSVRSRREFVEKSETSLMNDRVHGNLYVSVEGSSIPFELGFGKMRGIGRNRWSLPVKIRIPIDSLTTRSRGDDQTGQFSVFVVAGGPAAMSEMRRQTQPFRIPAADQRRAKSSHFTFDFTLEVDEKADRISVGVLDEVSKQFGLKRLAVPERADKRALLRDRILRMQRQTD